MKPEQALRKLPRIIRKTINRNAFRLARTEAYEYLCRDLEQQAQNLLNITDASVNEVIAVLEQSSFRWPDPPGE